MRVRAIVNPSSSHGRTGQIWPKLAATLSDALGAIEVAMSSGPLDATTKTREALRDGVDLVVAVGGDGTVNEVVNGFSRAVGAGSRGRESRVADEADLRALRVLLGVVRDTF